MPVKLNIFFYGLFMDVELLESKGIYPATIAKARLDGYKLFIGERATLVQSKGDCVYGMVMELSKTAIKDLYSEKSVRDYQAIAVNISLPDTKEAVSGECYILSENNVSRGTNMEYVVQLLKLAKNLQFPETYIQEISGFNPLT